MKIITQDAVYVQKGDLEYLLYNEPGFQPELFSSLMGMGAVNEFVKVTDPNMKAYLESSPIPSFNKLFTRTDYELDSMIQRLKKEMENNKKREDARSIHAKASELIARFKSQRRKAYFLSQYNEMLAYKKGVSQIQYPDIPNPCIRPISDGLVAGNLSLQRNKIIFYSQNGSSIDDKCLDIIFEMTIEEFKDRLVYPREDDEFEVVQRMNEDKTYLTYAVETRHCDTKLRPFMRLFRRK